MIQFKLKKYFFIYIILSFILTFVLKPINVKAETVVDRTILDKVYKLEINSKPSFDEIKKEILSHDIKYVIFPEKLEHDLVLSEILVSDIDYSSHQPQTVDLEIQRFTDSKIDKKKIDTVLGRVTLQFVDTTPPTITLKHKSLTITEGESFKAEDYLVDVSDNSFDKVDVAIQDNTNVDKAGTYEVAYIAVDESKNKTEEILKVTVKAKPKPPPVVRKAVVTPSPVMRASNDFFGALSIINSYRIANGLNPLQMGSSGEQAAAATRAAEAAGYLSHQRPDGRSYVTAFTDRGIYRSSIVEVLTYSGTTAADKVAWWMSSASHRANLMRRDITHIALGAYGNMWVGMAYR